MSGAYAELQVTSHFSFLRGASSCEELFAQVAALGIAALAIVDRNSLAGIVRAHQAAKDTSVRLADQLRRAMATFKFTSGVSPFRDKLVGGMVARGYAPPSPNAPLPSSRASAATAFPKATPPRSR